jgi:hypothetical protein
MILPTGTPPTLNLLDSSLPPSPRASVLLWAATTVL